MALLEVTEVSVSFTGLRALSEVTFQLDRGQILAVIGPNGAGKSTLFNVITGYVLPSKGRTSFRGHDISRLPPHRIAALGMRRTFQNGGVFASMTVLENVLAGLSQRTASSLAGIVFNTPRARVAERAAVEEARDLLSAMGLHEYAGRLADELPPGTQRQVEIVRALAARAQLIMLDEPAVGLSPKERENLTQMLFRLREQGIAVLIIEHVIDLVMAVADSILVLNHGEVLAHGRPAEIRADRSVMEAYLGRR